MEPYEMRDPDIGDYYKFLATETDSNGETRNNSYEFTMIGIWNDGTEVFQVQDSRGMSEYHYGDMWIENDGSEVIGTETVDSPIYGEVLCDVGTYEQDGVTVRVLTLSGTDAFVGQTYIYEGGATMELLLLDTSTFEEYGPGFLKSPEIQDLKEGDFYAYNVIAYDANGDVTNRYTSITRAVSVNGEDGITVGYTDRDGGYREEESTVDKFLDSMATEDMESTGKYAYNSWAYGWILCDRMVSETDQGTAVIYVGSEDGVAYGYEITYLDGTYEEVELVYSSLVVGSGAYATDSFRTEPETGEFGSCIYVVEQDGKIVKVGFMYKVLRSVIDDVQTVYYCDDWEHTWTTDQYYIAYSDDGIDKTPTDTYVSPYGILNCYIMAEEVVADDGVAYTRTCWVESDMYDFVVKEVHEYEDGLTITYYTNVETLFEKAPMDYGGPVVTGDLEVGDTIEYDGMLNGEYCSVTATVASTEEDIILNVTETVGDEQFTYTSALEGLLLPDEDAEFIGTSIMDTWYHGPMTLDVYSKENEGITAFEYCYEGIVMMVEYYEDSEMIGSYHLFNAANVY